MVPLWQVSSQPLLSIGVVEGANQYQLDGAISSFRFANGSIVVANSGSNELRFYTAAGRFAAGAGGRGGGPGEFQWLQRVYPHSDDSVMAYDGFRQVSVFDASGIFAWSKRVDSLFGDRPFPMDVWLHRRFWVEGERDSLRRLSINAALDRFEVPDSAPGYRFVQAAQDRSLWIREGRPGIERVDWTVVNERGNPIAVAQTLARFDIHQIGDDFVLGRWRDSDDINFIHMYAIMRTEERVPLPHWITVEPARDPLDTPGADSVPVRELRRILRRMVTSQEMYFEDHLRYADRVDSLDLEIPEELIIEFVTIDERSWAAVAIQLGSQGLCGMAIGRGTPPGWMEGTVVCGPDAPR